MNLIFSLTVIFTNVRSKVEAYQSFTKEPTLQESLWSLTSLKQTVESMIVVK